MQYAEAVDLRWAQTDARGAAEEFLDPHVGLDQLGTDGFGLLSADGAPFQTVLEADLADDRVEAAL